MPKLSDLSLSREQMLDIVMQSLTWKDVAARVGRTSLNKRERDIIIKKYGLDISAFLKTNKSVAAKKRKDAELDKIVTCCNCGKKYRNGDRLSANKSKHFFCSDRCARLFSANAKKEKRRERISRSLKEFYDKRRKIQGSAIKVCKVCGALVGKCSRPEICKHRLAFSNYIKYMGFDQTAMGSEKAYSEFEKLKNKIQAMYAGDRMSTRQIYDYFRNLYGYPLNQGSFYKLLVVFLPKRRSISEGLHCRLEHGPIHNYIEKPRFKTGVHTTWFGGKIQYRSSYELDLCKELDAGNIFYEVEPFTVGYFDTQLKKQRFAVPDFYLPEFNTIIEVKSEYTLNKQNMLDKANAYLSHGYNFILEYEHKAYDAGEIQYIKTRNITIN